MEATDRPGLHEVPLTFAQQLLWMLDFAHPGQAFAPGFIVRSRHRVHGPLHPDALRLAFDRVIARHGALRTTIETRGTMPFQTVHEAASIELDLVDVRPDEPTEKFFLTHELEERDVSAAPSIWARLGRIGGDEHLLSIVAHHAVCDTWSVGLILEDLAGHYRGIVDGDAVESPRPPDYAAFSIAQQSHDDANVGHRLGYWAEQLDGITPGPLAIDHDREPGGAAEKRVDRFVIEEDLAAGVAATVRRSRSTTFIVLLAAYAAHLAHRYGARDLTIPTITSSRHRSDTAGLVGYLNNAVPLRIVLDADPHLGEVLAVTRRVTFDAFAHEVPMVLLLDHVPDLGLLLSDDRFVTAPFQHVPYDAAPVELGNCRCVPEYHVDPPEIMAMPVDLISTLGSDEGRLVGDICYTAALFRPDTLAGLVSGFQGTLRALVDRPSQRLSDL